MTRYEIRSRGFVSFIPKWDCYYYLGGAEASVIHVVSPTFLQRRRQLKSRHPWQQDFLFAADPAVKAVTSLDRSRLSEERAHYWLLN